MLNKAFRSFCTQTTW